MPSVTRKPLKRSKRLLAQAEGAAGRTLKSKKLKKRGKRALAEVDGSANERAKNKKRSGKKAKNSS